MLRSVVVGSVLALALSGCRGEPQPTVTEPIVTEPSETASAPTDRPSATPSRPQDVRSFLSTWLRMQDQMFRTGDIESFTALNAPDCRPCQRLTQQVRAIHRAGGEIGDPENRLVTVTRTSRRDYRARILRKSYRIRRARNSQWLRVLANEYDLFFTLRRTPTSWKVTSFAIEANEQ